MKPLYVFGPVILASLAIASTGCATKKYVNNRVVPVEGRVTAAEKKAAEQGKTIDSVETDVSKTKERVLDLDAGLTKTSDRVQQVGTRANEAASAASQAQQQAADARTYAERRGNQLQQTLDTLVNLKLARSANVLFPTGRSVLDRKAASALGSIAEEAMRKKNFVFEVEGFTDAQGSASRNLILSQRRAEAVVRELTQTHKIPLRNIHLIGAGSSAPVGNNRTKDGRRLNRRVEIRLFAPEAELSSALTPAQSR